MAQQWNKLDKAAAPTVSTVQTLVGLPLFNDFLAYMQNAYAAEPVPEYSGCGMMPGWNLKFKKAGRGLCTLYPTAGGFTVLVVIGQREKPAMELCLPALTPYTQNLYTNTKEGMGQRWLLFKIENENAAVLKDVKQCIALRRKPHTAR